MKQLNSGVEKDGRCKPQDKIVAMTNLTLHWPEERVKIKEKLFEKF